MVEVIGAIIFVGIVVCSCVVLKNLWEMEL